MRIIGGTHRSRNILPPKDDGTTRPITDRVKQSLFDRLWAMGLLGDSPAEFGPPEMTGGGNVLDVFAGTGSLGLEALSRGAEYCTFIERDRASRALLERNLEDLGLAEQAQVLAMDALSPAWVAVLARRPVRLVFLDPPYRLSEDPEQMPRVTAVMAALAATPGIMEKGGALVLRMASPVLAPVVLGWTVPATVEYGSMALHFYQPAETV